MTVPRPSTGIVGATVCQATVLAGGTVALWSVGPSIALDELGLAITAIWILSAVGATLGYFVAEAWSAPARPDPPGDRAQIPIGGEPYISTVLTVVLAMALLLLVDVAPSIIGRESFLCAGFAGCVDRLPLWIPSLLAAGGSVLLGYWGLRRVGRE